MDGDLRRAFRVERNAADRRPGRRAVDPDRGLLALLWSWILGRQVAAKTRELREQQAFSRNVLDNLPVGVAVNPLDADAPLEYMNDLFPRFYRTTRGALSSVGAFWREVYQDPEFREQIRARVEADCASGDRNGCTGRMCPSPGRAQQRVTLPRATRRSRAPTA